LVLLLSRKLRELKNGHEQLGSPVMAPYLHIKARCYIFLAIRTVSTYTQAGGLNRVKYDLMREVGTAVSREDESLNHFIMLQRDGHRQQFIEAVCCFKHHRTWKSRYSLREILEEIYRAVSERTE
jgi:hypothetical protein